MLSLCNALPAESPVSYSIDRGEFLDFKGSELPWRPGSFWTLHRREPVTFKVFAVSMDGTPVDIGLPAEYPVDGVGCYLPRSPTAHLLVGDYAMVWDYGVGTLTIPFTLRGQGFRVKENAYWFGDLTAEVTIDG